MNQETNRTNREQAIELISGWKVLPWLLALLAGDILLFIGSLWAQQWQGAPFVPGVIAAILLFPVTIILLTGHFSLQPNEARVLVLFGRYKGTVRQSGFYWGNPFYSNGAKTGFVVHVQAGGSESQPPKPSTTATRAVPSRMRISLRVRNMNSEILKVNDRRGNPIEIAAVIVWRVQDTAQAMFDVDNYENYIRIQSESAIRHLASAYAYDHGEENEVTLRSGVDEVSEALRRELQTRLDRAGVVVEEARITHLAYAPEIAQAMLRRQQAEAVIAARQKIVHGAVSMVDMALKELAEKHVVSLDDERKAAMVSNLMVVLCGEAEIHPVINTGTLYS